MSGEKNKIIDKGWLQMEQLLDQEMPIQRKRRKLLWLPLFGLFLFTLGGLYLNLFTVNKSNNIEINKQPYSNDSNLITGQEDNEATENKSPSKSTNASFNSDKNEEILTIKFQNSNQSNLGSENKNSFENHVLLNTSKKVNKNEKLTTQNPNLSPENSVYAVNTSLNEKTQSAPQTFISDNSGSHIENSEAEKPVFLLSSIKSLKIKSLETLLSISTPEPFLIHPSESNNGSISWFVGLKGDRLIQRDMNLIGFEIGLVKKPLLKWGYSSRVSYSKSLSSLTTSTLENSELDMSNTINTGAEFDNSALAQSLEAPTLNLMQVSFTPEYYFNDKFSFSGGPALAYQWGKITSNNTVNSSGTRTNIPGTVNYNTFNYGVTSGLNYNVFKRLSLGLEYSFFLKPLATESKAEQLRLLPSEPISKQMFGLRMRFAF